MTSWRGFTPRSFDRVEPATRQPSPGAPTSWSSGTNTSSSSTSLNSASPVSCTSGWTSTPGACMSTTKNDRPLCLGAVGVAAGQAHPPVGELRVRGPDLAPVEPPAPVHAPGRGAHRGEVGSGVGLGEELAPQLPRRWGWPAASAPSGRRCRGRAASARPGSHRCGRRARGHGRAPAPPARRSSRPARGRGRRRPPATSPPPSRPRPGPPATGARRPPLRRGRRSAAADPPRTPMAGGCGATPAAGRGGAPVPASSSGPSTCASMTHASGSRTGLSIGSRPWISSCRRTRSRCATRRRAFSTGACPMRRVRQVADTDRHLDDELWAAMAEQGWPAVERSERRRRSGAGPGRGGGAVRSSWDATWRRCPSPAPWWRTARWLGRGRRRARTASADLGDTACRGWARRLSRARPSARWRGRAGRCGAGPARRRAGPGG